MVCIWEDTVSDNDANFFPTDNWRKFKWCTHLPSGKNTPGTPVTVYCKDYIFVCNYVMQSYLAQCDVIYQITWMNCLANISHSNSSIHFTVNYFNVLHFNAIIKIAWKLPEELENGMFFTGQAITSPNRIELKSRRQTFGILVSKP